MILSWVGVRRTGLASRAEDSTSHYERERDTTGQPWTSWLRPSTASPTWPTSPSTGGLWVTLSRSTRPWGGRTGEVRAQLSGWSWAAHLSGCWTSVVGQGRPPWPWLREGWQLWGLQGRWWGWIYHRRWSNTASHSTTPPPSPSARWTSPRPSPSSPPTWPASPVSHPSPASTGSRTCPRLSGSLTRSIFYYYYILALQHPAKDYTFTMLKYSLRLDMWAEKWIKSLFPDVKSQLP